MSPSVLEVLGVLGALATIIRMLWEGRSWLTSGPHKFGSSSDCKQPAQYAKGLGLLTRREVEETFAAGTWQAASYQAFRNVMLSTDPVVYPCVYASKGFKAAEHRYLFLDSEDPRNEENLRRFAWGLGQYLAASAQLGPNTSFVVLFPPAPSAAAPKSVEQYHANYWLWLDALARHDDAQAWPAHVPRRLDDPKWRFCFRGEALFSVCLTPAHARRRSRACACFCLVFQPEFVLRQLFSTPQKKQGAMGKVRGLLADYDRVAISPELKEYGDETGRESRQYFLMDDNTSSIDSPFNQLGVGFA